MVLIQNEVRNTQFNFGNIALTNYRVSVSNGDFQRHIPLEKISCITLLSQRYSRWLLVLGVVLFAVGIYTLSDSSEELGMLLLLVGLILVLCFVLIRRNTINIQSDGGDAIVYRVGASKKEDVEIAVARFLEAKNARIEQLYSLNSTNKYKGIEQNGIPADAGS
ncbi:hypothetical protein AGMMS4956_16150 [Bacteroidia bacterium]|nr:hypothetical protein AGMMS4956_16150 [Bacteroidia bacterium]